MKLSIGHNVGSAVSAIRKFPNRLRRHVATSVLEKAGKRIIEQSKKRTPIEFHRLIESHKMRRAVVKRGSVGVSVSVGDDEAWYAHIVHEDLAVAHPQGEAKFLETSVIEETGPIRKGMELAVTKVWKSLPWETF